MKIKQERGWFPAGDEMLRAFNILSDGAFRLYFYVCLHASRTSATYVSSQALLAKSVHRSKGSTGKYIEEMRAAGVLDVNRARNQHEESAMKICERFWPYVYSDGADLPTEQVTFLQGISQLLHERACVKSRFSNADNDYAIELYARGISLLQIERAVHLACFRKYSSLLSQTTKDLIVSFLYFQDVIDEVTDPEQPIHGQTDEWYGRNLRLRMLQVEQQWIAQHSKGLHLT